MHISDKRKKVTTVTVWIKSLRLPICFLAGLLAIASFKIADIPISWLSVAAVFFGACATMLQNDWRDRYHDIRKGKTLALKYPRAFLALLLAFWAIACSLAITVGIENINAGIVLFLMALAGLAYSEVRRIPMAPVTLVVFTSGSPVLLPIAAGAEANKVLWLFLSTALIIFGREITKDIDDHQIDGGYKWTIPLAVGSQWAKTIAVIAIAAGLAVAVKVSAAVLPAIILAVIGLILLLRWASPKAARICLDAGVALAILTVIIFGFKIH